MILRLGMWLLTFVNVTVGLWATLAPRSFYDDVPLVDVAPPYAEHLMRDYGAMNLALALVCGVAAVTMNRLLVRTALAAYLLFSIPHLIFHAAHVEHPGDTATITLIAALAVAAAIPALLLSLTRHIAPSPPPP